MQGVDFDSIIDPVQSEVFLNEYWEKRPLVIQRNAKDYYRNIFSRRAFESLLWSTRPEWGVIQISNHSRGEKWTDYTLLPPSPGNLAKAYRQGDTLILNDVQKFWGPVAELTRSFEREFNFAINVNAYLTPSQAQGFSPHYDLQEVFILQIEGSKHWNLYEDPIGLPLENRKVDLSSYRKERAGLRVMLQPGDLLHIPRGVVHEAVTAGEASLHLTVGIGVLSWRHLLETTIRLATDSMVELRHALPPRFALSSEGTQALQHKLEELFRRMSETVLLEGAINQLAQRFFNRLEPAVDELFAPPRAITVDLSSVVRTRRGMLCRVSRENGSASLQFPGGGLTGPAELAPALEFIAACERFEVAQIPGLSDRSKLVLVKRLIAEGLLEVDTGRG